MSEVGNRSKNRERGWTNHLTIKCLHGILISTGMLGML